MCGPRLIPSSPPLARNGLDHIVSNLLRGASQRPMDTISKSRSAPEAREEEEARRRLATLPGFSRALAEAAQLTRLVGMNNRVFRVDVDARTVCLRIPGSGAAAAVDRRVEEVNARAAAKAGVAPEVLYFGKDGEIDAEDAVVHTD